MACALFQELLSAHLDAELDAREAESVHQHLLSCAACRMAFADLKETQRLIRTLKPLPVPAALWPVVLEKTIPVKRPMPFFLRVSRDLAAVAASLALVLGLITLIGYVTPEPVSKRESNIYLGGHAYHLMRQPLADHSSWSYVAGESNFELLSEE